MTPIEETFIRLTMLLDEPKQHRDRQAIKDHFDTLVDYARNDDEKRAAYEFKAMAMNHIDSDGIDPPEFVEEKRVRALEALTVFSRIIESSKHPGG
ncbi:hypothetical protein J7481_22670 [Labrenzia sp. R4_2]|uniref:hypothetical protein n=1 Tax=Labrenzia sp. R4_2 TaxID=2821107 RepID=UPI001ADCB115|nr:hypothetical protein [Labrenzia sp. R4_2]MBO9422332.1 hypothetical protein [Labrenzia sp. R4_2]